MTRNVVHTPEIDRDAHRSVPSPLVGEGQGGGESRTSEVGSPPSPGPSPRAWGAPAARRGGESRRICGAQSGITLIEVVVALAITALALAIAGGGFRLLSRSGDRGAQLIARHEDISRGLDVLRHDIERLERVVWKRRESTEFAFRADAGRLVFVVIEPPFPAEAGPYFVVYAIQQRRDGATLTRERAPYQAAADLGRLKTADSVAVLEGAYRLRFVYLERNDGRERWVTEWPDPTRIPELVGLEVGGLTGDPVRIVLRPRIDAERSCVKEDGDTCTVGTRGVLAPEPAAGSGEGKSGEGKSGEVQ